MVVNTLLTSTAALTAKEDLTMAISVLLNATTNQSGKKGAKMTKKKKALHNFSQLPESYGHRAHEFTEKTRNVSKLMHAIRKDCL